MGNYLLRAEITDSNDLQALLNQSRQNQTSLTSITKQNLHSLHTSLHKQQDLNHSLNSLEPSNMTVFQ
jgi:hypothetical protein